ncbi:MAG: hypothetical protein AABZ60_20485 [Planctomycetota bacterium]
MEFSAFAWWQKFQEMVRYGIPSEKLETLASELEREKRRSLLKIDKSYAKQQRMIERIKIARQQNRSSEIDLWFQELQVLREDQQALIRDIKILGLESLTLKRYLKCLQHLDQSKQKKMIPKILKRLQQKNLSAKLLAKQVDSSGYFEELEQTFQEIGLEPEDYDASSIETEKKAFLREIDTLIQAEKSAEIEE